jgi:hypothetical protein
MFTYASTQSFDQTDNYKSSQNGMSLHEGHRRESRTFSIRDPSLRRAHRPGGSVPGKYAPFGQDDIFKTSLIMVGWSRTPIAGSNMWNRLRRDVQLISTI